MVSCIPVLRRWGTHMGFTHHVMFVSLSARLSLCMHFRAEDAGMQRVPGARSMPAASRNRLQHVPSKPVRSDSCSASCAVFLCPTCLPRTPPSPPPPCFSRDFLSLPLPFDCGGGAAVLGCSCCSCMRGSSVRLGRVWVATKRLDPDLDLIQVPVEGDFRRQDKPPDLPWPGGQQGQRGG